MYESLGSQGVPDLGYEIGICGKFHGGTSPMVIDFRIHGKRQFSHGLEHFLKLPGVRRDANDHQFALGSAKSVIGC
jgi:hypothetical protein